MGDIKLTRNKNESRVDWAIRSSMHGVEPNTMIGNRPPPRNPAPGWNGTPSGYGSLTEPRPLQKLNDDVDPMTGRQLAQVISNPGENENGGGNLIPAQISTSTETTTPTTTPPQISGSEGPESKREVLPQLKGIPGEGLYDPITPQQRRAGLENLRSQFEAKTFNVDTYLRRHQILRTSMEIGEVRMEIARASYPSTDGRAQDFHRRNPKAANAAELARNPFARQPMPETNTGNVLNPNDTYRGLGRITGGIGAAVGWIPWIGRPFQNFAGGLGTALASSKTPEIMGGILSEFFQPEDITEALRNILVLAAAGPTAGASLAPKLIDQARHVGREGGPDLPKNWEWNWVHTQSGTALPGGGNSRILTGVLRGFQIYSAVNSLQGAGTAGTSGTTTYVWDPKTKTWTKVITPGTPGTSGTFEYIPILAAAVPIAFMTAWKNRNNPNTDLTTGLPIDQSTFPRTPTAGQLGGGGPGPQQGHGVTQKQLNQLMREERRFQNQKERRARRALERGRQ